jgi:hypothetical protein
MSGARSRIFLFATYRRLTYDDVTAARVTNDCLVLRIGVGPIRGEGDSTLAARSLQEDFEELREGERGSAGSGLPGRSALVLQSCSAIRPPNGWPGPAG